MSNMIKGEIDITRHRYDINDPEDIGINVPLLAGLLSGLGTLFLGLLCAAIWFAVVGEGRIRLGNLEPGAFDDEQSVLEEEQQALELMDENEREQYLLAKEFQSQHPPNSINTDISLSQFMAIQEKGASAWQFEPDSNNCYMQGRTEMEFLNGPCTVMTNLPIPKQNDVYYWEAKIYDKPELTNISVGLCTKPYPTFRLPGYHRYSVAYDSDGKRRLNQPFSAPSYGIPLQTGDVVGVGYRPRTGTVFFTRNGKKFDDAVHGMRMNLFPSVGADGPCTIMVNFGRAGFVFIEANAKKWGLAPAQGSLAPPPPYGAEHDFVLLESGVESSESQEHPTGGNTLHDNVRDGHIPSSSNRAQTFNPPPPPFNADDVELAGNESIGLARFRSTIETVEEEDENEAEGENTAESTEGIRSGTTPRSVVTSRSGITPRPGTTPQSTSSEHPESHLINRPSPPPSYISTEHDSEEESSDLGIGTDTNVSGHSSLHDENVHDENVDSQ